MPSLYIDPKFIGKNFPFPKHDIDPKKKTKDWMLGWCRAIYGQYVNNNTYYNNSWYSNITDLRRYALGKQDSAKYKDQILGGKERDTTGQSKRKGYVNVNFENIFSPAPKYMDVIEGQMESTEHTVVVTAEDENSGTEKLNAKEAMWFRAQEKPFLEMMDDKLGIKRKEDDFMPESREELDLYDDMGGFKLRYEVAMEQALSHTFSISEWKQIKRQVIRDLATTNMAATMDYVDTYEGKVKFKYIDFAELIIEYSKDWNFSRSRWGAVVNYMTIEELRTSGCGLKEDQLRAVAQQYKDMYGNNSFGGWADNVVKYDDGSYGYDNYRIPVLEAYWKSFDRSYKVRKKTEKGEIRVNQKKFGKIYDTDKKKTEEIDIKVIYKSNWIVGTDYVFDTGHMEDTPRDGGEVKLPFHVYRIPGESIVSRMRPVLDHIELTYLKLQNAIAKAAPAGLMVEIGSLENISLGNKKMSPKDLIKIYQQDGTMFYRATPFGSSTHNFNAGPPIMPHAGSLGNAVSEAIQAFEMGFNQISEITGIARNATASVDPSATATSQQLAVAATNNALKPMYAGYLSIKEGCSRNAALRIQILCKYNEDAERGYHSVIGKTDVNTLKDAGDTPAVKWGIKIEALPTEAIKAEIKAAAQNALNSGKNGSPILTMGEYLYISQKLESGSGFTQVRTYLAYKEHVSNQMAQQQQEENMRINAEEARKTEEAKKQAELEKMQMEADIELKKIQLKYDLELRNEKARQTGQFESDTYGKMLDQQMAEQSPDLQVNK